MIALCCGVVRCCGMLSMRLFVVCVVLWFDVVCRKCCSLVR